MSKNYGAVPIFPSVGAAKHPKTFEGERNGEHHPIRRSVRRFSLRGFFVRPVSFEGSPGQAQVAQFRVDVSENENAYLIRAEISGVKKDDINISIDGDQVAISAKRITIQ